MPRPRLVSMNKMLNKNRRNRFPAMVTWNQKKAATRIKQHIKDSYEKKRMVFPASAEALTGVTMSCSIVPISFSFTRAIAVIVIVCNEPDDAQYTGDHEIHALELGLYHI